MIFSFSELVCDWLEKTNYIGVKTTIEVGNIQTKEECVVECLKKKLTNSNINGIQRRSWTDMCTCTVGMEGQHKLDDYTICYFTSKSE